MQILTNFVHRLYVNSVLTSKLSWKSSPVIVCEPLFFQQTMKWNLVNPTVSPNAYYRGVRTFGSTKLASNFKTCHGKIRFSFCPNVFDASRQKCESCLLFSFSFLFLLWSLPHFFYSDFWFFYSVSFGLLKKNQKTFCVILVSRFIISTVIKETNCLKGGHTFHKGSISAAHSLQIILESEIL